MGKITKFEHVISLGFFCSPALELKKLGFRDASYPFDWVISEWGGRTLYEDSF